MWHILPKAHMTTHMAYDFAPQGRNPRRITCYPDEDMVGKVKTIVEACHGKTAADRALFRYGILVCTRWWTWLLIERACIRTQHLQAAASNCA